MRKHTATPAQCKTMPDSGCWHCALTTYPAHLMRHWYQSSAPRVVGQVATLNRMFLITKWFSNKKLGSVLWLYVHRSV